MRALNSWLKAVHADGLVLARTRVAGPWGFAVQPCNAVVFHFVAEGPSFVRQPHAQTMSLQAGELILFPPCREHRPAPSPRGRTRHLGPILAKPDGIAVAGSQAV